jgi:SAM-dependent methyltransferase
MLKLFDRVARLVPGWGRLRHDPAFRSALGFEETLWTRRVPDREVRKLVAGLDPASLSALEISGRVWAEYGFREYERVEFPAFDICADVLPCTFDLVIAEHVFEHLKWPYRAARNVLAMLNPGGSFLIVTPFLYKVHRDPIDCTRWTEDGLRYFLAECGFGGEIVTGSWGNRRALVATWRKEYRLFNRYLHSVENEPDYPIAVWALARRS